MMGNNHKKTVQELLQVSLKLALEREGWGRRSNGSIEGEVERASFLDVQVHGASRTDRGVHARGMMAHADIDCNIAGPLDFPELIHQINLILRSDVRVVAIERAEPDFHATFNASGKTYSYRLYFGLAQDPFDADMQWDVLEQWCAHNKVLPSSVRDFDENPIQLDVDEMRRAAAYMVGTHDFKAFSSSQADQPQRGTKWWLTRDMTPKGYTRTVSAIEFFPEGDDALRIEITGDGFLTHQVRKMVGCLVDVGLGRLFADAVPRIIASRNRSELFQPARAHGLCLERVYYEKDYFAD